MSYLYSSHRTEPKHAPSSLLTPENCVSSSRIRAFLRLSRIATDDTIRQHLNEVGPSQCSSYFKSKIVPQWTARAEAIRFCSDYAEDLHKHTEVLKTTAHTNDELRLDPYAAKNESDKVEEQMSQYSAIATWVSNESKVESIIQEQTARVLNDKCYYSDWVAEFTKISGTKLA